MSLTIESFADKLTKLSKLTVDNNPKIKTKNDELIIKFKYSMRHFSDENAEYLNEISDKWRLGLDGSVYTLEVYIKLGNNNG
jgi:hypothetical protein